MFGRKKTELPPQAPIIISPPNDSFIQQDEDYNSGDIQQMQPKLVQQAPQQIPQQQYIPQPQYQQVQQPMPQQVQQQAYAPMQQPKGQQARIIRGELNDTGFYAYIVETNYPLTLGWCSLSN